MDCPLGGQSSAAEIATTNHKGPKVREVNTSAVIFAGIIDIVFNYADTMHRPLHCLSSQNCLRRSIFKGSNCGRKIAQCQVYRRVVVKKTSFRGGKGVEANNTRSARTHVTNLRDMLAGIILVMRERVYD